MRGKQQIEDVEGGEEEEEEEEYRRAGDGGGFWMSAVNAASGMDMIPESGFISSQPSMAEFILPHHITGGEPSPGPYPQQIDPQQSVQEYPWMKEKKTARKSNQQGEYHFHHFITFFDNDHGIRLPRGQAVLTDAVFHLKTKQGQLLLRAARGAGAGADCWIKPSIRRKALKELMQSKSAPEAGCPQAANSTLRSPPAQLPLRRGSVICRDPHLSVLCLRLQLAEGIHPS
ncbi:unnamed protein product [Nezara viridula]|uniref:Uncharacterized protein n=1 Tax=Nezara viridula TaxID=85310 RepID=A0A9P0HML8_NEZVI|nr:unnamed protein product [Nezara viridula]